MDYTKGKIILPPITQPGTVHPSAVQSSVQSPNSSVHFEPTHLISSRALMPDDQNPTRDSTFHRRVILSVNELPKHTIPEVDEAPETPRMFEV